MTPELIIGIVISSFFVLFTLEQAYKPRIDVTRKGEVLLWYNKNKKRAYKYLFSIYHN